ncbi:hypothetical protein Hanom_Chr11g01011651 [Helianthus anomalus]
MGRIIMFNFTPITMGVQNRIIRFSDNSEILTSEPESEISDIRDLLMAYGCTI